MNNAVTTFLKCMRWPLRLAIFSLALVSHGVHAQQYELPTDGSTIIGAPRLVAPDQRNTLLDIARHFDLGHHEITWANPTVDTWLPHQHGPVLIPTEYILPPKPWTGIVINISQRRLFYFPTPAKGEPAKVITLPISIAREGWSTPLGDTKIVGKHKDPAWWVPKSIQEEHRAEGIEDFPEYFPPGPDNPMGMLAIQLGFKSIFIHGTNRPWGVGMRTSHGCLHLYPEDAVVLFDLIKPGVPVRVIDEPVVVGVRDNQLYLAHYQPVAEYGTSQDSMTRATVALAPLLQSAVQPAAEDKPQPVFNVDWDRVRLALSGPQVLPISIAPASDTLEDRLAALTVEPYHEEPFGTDANNAMPPERDRPATAE